MFLPDFVNNVGNKRCFFSPLILLSPHLIKAASGCEQGQGNKNTEH